MVSNGLQLIGDSQSFSIFLLLVILTISPNLDAVNLQLLSSNHRLLEICPRVVFFQVSLHLQPVVKYVIHVEYCLLSFMPFLLYYQ